MSSNSGASPFKVALGRWNLKWCQNVTKHPETWLSGIGSVDLSTNARLALRDGGKAKKSKESATQHTKDC